MNYHFQFKVDQSDSGNRVDDFVAARLGSLSKMRIANLIEARACLVNGAVARAGQKVLAGDSVELSFAEGPPTSMSPEPIPLEVVHEDTHLLVVVKPAGILVHPTLNVKSGTLANALVYHLNKSRIENGGWTLDQLSGGRFDETDRSTMIAPVPVIRPGIIHRLDRATSGLMVIAKTSRALTVLSRHFRKRLVKKRYEALVAGDIRMDAGSIDAPIGRDPERQPQWGVMETGKAAQTRFKVIERLGRSTLLELEPVTGRTNQLRIHCAYVGHPIVGDEMHAANESELSNLRLDAETHCECEYTSMIESERLCLHAAGLSFHHPVGGEWMEFTSPLPADFERVVSHFRKPEGSRQ